MRVKIDFGEVNMPDFLIVGAGKSGTTSLHYYLVEHPDIYMPWHKETWFFHLKDNPNKAILALAPYLPTNLLSYTGLFANAKPNQICGEATPSYLYYHDLTIANIKKIHPDWRNLKIIIILREPIEKVLSHYKFVRNNRLDPENLSLKEALAQESRRKKENKVLPDLFFVDNTLYYNQVKSYLDTFDNVKIFLYSDLQNNSEKLIRDLYTFVGVNSDFTPKSINKVYNRSKVSLVPRNSFIKKITQLKSLQYILPPILRRYLYPLLYKEEMTDKESIEFLKKAFKDDVLRLQSILKRDISDWVEKYR